MDRIWRPLPAAPRADVPPLLVAASFGPASYTVAVTDLARVWSESLDRRTICMRAFQDNTTIDPSYDNEQMGVFLGTIQSAFAQPNPSKPGAESSPSLVLAPSGDDLVLHISCPLPGGLPPLAWSLHLARRADAAIAPSLVQPLIRDRARRQRAAEALVAALRQKDAVIAKLVDKLDAIGAGAESAFPSLLPAGGGGTRRAVPRMARADMERRIHGLAPFDEAGFQKQLNAADAVDDEADLPSLVATFGELPCDDGDGDGGGASAVDSAWWKNLGSRVALKRVAGAPDSHGTMQSDGTPKGGEDEDGFQTSPGATGSGQTADDVAAPQAPPSPTPTTSKASKAGKPKGLGKIGRLGGIGKGKKKETPVEPAPPAVEDNDATASEAEAEAETAAAGEVDDTDKTEKTGETDEIHKTETVAAVRPKTRRGLGRIGGKKEKEAEETKDVEPAGDARPEESAKRKTDDNESPGTPAPAPAPRPRPPEAISEAKRAEILQQAVAKNAAPVRKKRKF